MSDLRDMIEQTRAAIDTVAEDKKMPLINSLVNLVKKMAGNVISFHDIPARFENEVYPALCAQVDAAKKRTEKAADDIMSATENIMNALSKVEGEGQAQIQESVNALFEACNFQDLVAQHLEIIKDLSDELAEDMQELRDAIDTMGGGESGKAPERKRKQKRPDAHLLNGPVTNI